MTSTNTTHLLWVDRWIEVRQSNGGWIFKSGRDAADWLLYPVAQPQRSEP